MSFRFGNCLNILRLVGGGYKNVSLIFVNDDSLYSKLEAAEAGEVAVTKFPQNRCILSALFSRIFLVGVKCGSIFAVDCPL